MLFYGVHNVLFSNLGYGINFNVLRIEDLEGSIMCILSHKLLDKETSRMDHVPHASVYSWHGIFFCYVQVTFPLLFFFCINTLWLTCKKSEE